MGHNTAVDLAENLDLSIEAQLSYHLQANHYPPVPVSMVPVCIEAINAYWDDDTDKLITLPEGVLWRNQTEAPAWSILEGHHLSAWTADYDIDEVYDLYDSENN